MGQRLTCATKCININGQFSFFQKRKKDDAKWRLVVPLSFNITLRKVMSRFPQPVSHVGGYRRWARAPRLVRALGPTYLSSAHCLRRCWALGEWSENLSTLRQFCFSGDSLLRSCSNSCSYISLWRSNADRFSSSCCCSRLFNIDCIGSK